MSAPQVLLAGRYRLVRLIAAGGMGVVWEGWDERLRRPVAIKQLRAQEGVPAEEAELAKDRAMREARITGRLHHPHAVPVFDVVEHDGQPVLIMQYLPSTPLAAVLRDRGPLPPAEVARVGAEIASALAAAHKLGIVHRDVKPGNILIAEDGVAMISDFGISHALGDATITRTGLVHGTPAYLAPEVARGGATSFASDVFSLGSTLYAALEGSPPFGMENNSIALLHKVARGSFPPPERGDVLTPLVLRMLSADPQARPAMKSVASQLSALRDLIEPTAESEPPVAAAAVAVGLGALGAAGALRTPPGDDVTAVAEPAGEDDPIAPPAHDDALTATAEPVADEAPPEAGDAPTEAARPEADEDPTVTAEPIGAHAGGTAELGVWEALTAAATAQAPAQAPAPAAPSAVPAAAPVAPVATHALEPPRPDRPTESFGAPAAEPPRPRDRRRRALIAGGAVVLLVVALLITVVVRDQLDRGTTARPAATVPSGSTPRPAVTASPSPANTPASTPANTPANTPATPSAAPSAAPPPAQPGPPTAAQLADAITGYYALLPGGTAAAWPRMTADYQENHAGGRDAYERFWAAVDRVTVGDVTGSPPDGAAATVTYYFRDGRVVVERTSYHLVQEDGILRIAESTVLSSVPR